LKRKNDIDFNLILSGVGGQGVLFATSVFSETALALGYDVLGSETHGMSQRGGSVISHLKVGSYESPLVRQGTADVLLAFDEQEAYRSLSFVRRNGLCFVNSGNGDFWDTGVKGYLLKNGIAAHSFPADELALRMGSPRSANLVLIGYALSLNGVPFHHDQIRETIERITPQRFRQLNLEAFEAGYRREQ
jgi:indolepyruvate ferredoxin oxidoreductase beta subunit